MAKVVQFTVTSSVDYCNPYRVVASCGHVDIRMMRQATAGIPWTETATLHAPYGMPCKACRAAGK